MSIKNAAFFAFIGMILLTVVLAIGFFNQLTAYLRDLTPIADLLKWFVAALAGISLSVFFFVFHRTHS